MTTRAYTLCFCFLAVFANANAQVKETLCQTARRLGLQTQPKLGAFIPICNAAGNYEAKQCMGDWCFCVNKDFGYSLEKYRHPRKSACGMNCLCARKEEAIVPWERKTNPIKCALNGNFIPAPAVSSCLEKALATKHVAITSQSLLRCAADGTYKPVQCNKDKCWCADKTTGDKLESETPLGKDTRDMDCECARGKAEAKKNNYVDLSIYVCKTNGNFMPPCGAGKVRHPPKYNKYDCDAEGFFKPLQCGVVSGQCYCADKYTGQMIGLYHYNSADVRLPSTCQCARDEIILGRNNRGLSVKCRTDGSYTQCFEELTEYNKKNISDAFSEPPICNCVGQYKAKQCKLTQCFCVDKFGNKIENYAVPRYIGRGNMTCACARDQYAYILGDDYTPRKKFYCDAAGGYHN